MAAQRRGFKVGASAKIEYSLSIKITSRFYSLSQSQNLQKIRELIWVKWPA